MNEKDCYFIYVLDEIILPIVECLDYKEYIPPLVSRPRSKNKEILDREIVDFSISRKGHNNKITESSMLFIIDRKLTQSESIKLGINLERLLGIIIMRYSNKNLQNIKPTMKKGVKEMDHVFLDKKSRIVYYAELKCNLNLDTEKSKSTSEKCLHNLENLKKLYPAYKIQMYLVNLRYYDEDIPFNIINKFKTIKDNVITIDKYLHYLGVTLISNREDYLYFINKLSNV